MFSKNWIEQPASWSRTNECQTSVSLALLVFVPWLPWQHLISIHVHKGTQWRFYHYFSAVQTLSKISKYFSTNLFTLMDSVFPFLLIFPNGETWRHQLELQYLSKWTDCSLLTAGNTTKYHTVDAWPISCIIITTYAMSFVAEVTSVTLSPGTRQTWHYLILILPGEWVEFCGHSDYVFYQ